MKKKETRGRKRTKAGAYLDKVPRADVYAPKGGGLTRAQLGNAQKTPIRLGILSDMFAMGIFCQKAGLTEYAFKVLKRVRSGESASQFEKGKNEADDYTLNDIAMEMAEIRKVSPFLFDAYIEQVSGKEVIDQIKAAIKHAESNPWPSLNHINGGINKASRSVFVDGIGRPEARKFSFYNKPKMGAAV